jgi:5-methyltetrahydropteroyltriglutamate--homocysteine methyltransferase
MLKSTIVGNYPKLSSRKGDVSIRRVLHRFDKREIDREELDRSFDEVTARVIREQVESGIDLPTDGQVRWDDIVTPLASDADGFEIGGLLRWFDNNVYYRKPIVVAPTKWRQPVTTHNFRFACKEAGRPIKAVLPSPYSFARLSEDKHYHNDEKLLADLVTLLRHETEALVEAGAQDVQFDDPCLQFHPEDIEIAAEAFNAVVEGIKVRAWLCFYFGNIEKVAGQFGRFRASVVAADCISQPTNFDSLMRSAGEKTPCFGLLDARNIKLESADQLQESYRKIAGRFPDAYISPSCGLEFLPHGNALEKITLLGRSVRQFRGE